MNSTEIKNFIINHEKIIQDLTNTIDSLPVEISEELEELFNSNNVSEIYNIINKHFPNSGVTLTNLKLSMFFQDTRLKDQLLTQEEYTSFLKELIDIYGINYSQVLNLNDKKNSMENWNFLLSLEDQKYNEIYKSILEKKLLSVRTTIDFLELIKNSNTNYLSEELVINFLNTINIFPNSAEEILRYLPNSMLKDGKIAKIFFEKANISDVGKYFDLIPNELRTRDMWEKICTSNFDYINQIPNTNIDPNITQEEYSKWLENTIVKYVSKNLEEMVVNFKIINDDKITISLCQKLAELAPNNICLDLLQFIPERCRTQKLYETLALKDSKILREIPLKTFVTNISEEEYDKWFENLISQIIKNSHIIDKDRDAYNLYISIPKPKINERIWNEYLDKCLSENAVLKYACIKNLDPENITPQMVERAMKEIDVGEIRDFPCIDQNLEDIRIEERENFKKWQASLSNEQKEAYRKWYEQIWINSLNKGQYKNEMNPGGLLQCVPRNAITFAMKKACIEKSFDGNSYTPIAKYLPLPESPEQLKEYQDLLIYYLNLVPTVDYTNEKAIGRVEYQTERIDILSDIPKEYINEGILRKAVEKAIKYLTYADESLPYFDELLDIAYKSKLESLGRTELTPKERELIHKFYLNNADLFKTLQLEVLDSKILNTIGEDCLEKIVRYKDTQYLILNVAKTEIKLKTLGFVLNNLKSDNLFIEPLIEKISDSITHQNSTKFSSDSVFLDLVSKRLDQKDIPFSDYEKVIISYLTLNPQEGKKIKNYDDILTFVERKNNELESIINNNSSTLLDVKRAYLEKATGLDYESTINLIKMYGNDPEALLQYYDNVSPESYKELSEKEALEIIIKLKSVIETVDINLIKSEFQKIVSMENKETSYLRYQKCCILENSLRRAYGRDVTNSLLKDSDTLPLKEYEYNGEKYYVRNIEGNFNRMVSLLGAYRESSASEGDMYDRWNTNQMANNHALCYSLINQSNPGTALIHSKTGVIISINGFSPESLSAAAPYDLCSDNRNNTVQTSRQQRFFTAKNMQNQVRGNYSEYDIELQDVLSNSKKYQKIQPATIICFEEIDEDSINASIELSKRLGYTVPIELIDRRKLANEEMLKINSSLEKFKIGENIDTSLVETIITSFNNVRNAHRFSNLSDEIMGEYAEVENKDAPFNRIHLNQILKECLQNIEQRIRNGQVQEGLKALENIKNIINDERQKSFLMPTMYEKQLWTGIDLDIDYILDNLQRTYGKQNIKPLKNINSLDILMQLPNQDLSSITYDITYREKDRIEQLPKEDIISLIDIQKIEKGIEEIHEKGYYKDNKDYDEEHIARVILFSDLIAKMEGFDDKTRNLITEVAKYYSCGRQLDIPESHEKYSADLAGKALTGKYSQTELSIIKATIELQNFDFPESRNSEYEAKINEKAKELCKKYSIAGDLIPVIKKMSTCIKDSVNLDKTRFVHKASDMPKVAKIHNGFELSKSLNIGSLKTDSSKKLLKFSYSLQEKLAQQELDKLSSLVHIDYQSEKKQIMDAFFVDETMYPPKYIVDEKIIDSPIVKLEYLKTKYPEIAKLDYEEFKKQRDSINIKTKSLEKLQLEKQIRDLRRKQFEIKVKELGLQNSPTLTLDQLLKEQEKMEQVIESSKGKNL